MIDGWNADFANYIGTSTTYAPTYVKNGNSYVLQPNGAPIPAGPNNQPINLATTPVYFSNQPSVGLPGGGYQQIGVVTRQAFIIGNMINEISPQQPDNVRRLRRSYVWPLDYDDGWYQKSAAYTPDFPGYADPVNATELYQPPVPISGRALRPEFAGFQALNSMVGDSKIICAYS